MRTDRIPDSLFLNVGTDGGDTSRKTVEHRSFSQSSLTLTEIGQSQAVNENEEENPQNDGDY